MIDLSNLNGEPDFKRLYHDAGQRRVYMKVTEGLSFNDRFFAGRRARARAVGFKVGGYHFAHPSNNAVAEARHFVSKLGRVEAGDLRPCLDFEEGTPSASWAIAFLDELRRLSGVRGIIYSYADFVHRAGFRSPPAPLWLASYGRNDGREHPFKIPSPWRGIVAHQYSSRARIAGVPGFVDISRVFVPSALDVRRVA